MAVLVLQSLRSQQSPRLGAGAALVAAAVAVHAMLHGLEAPTGDSAALWWLGALTGSVLVSGGSCLLLRRLWLGPEVWPYSSPSAGVAALGSAGLLIR